ncbi:MAG: hypothetical protein ABSB81_08245 [Halobacteriota archaeon]|jgi:hypothetical protein
MVVTTNAVGDPSIENIVEQLTAPTSASFLKKLIVRIACVRYGVSALSSALNEAVSLRRRREPQFHQTGQCSASHPGGALD